MSNATHILRVKHDEPSHEDDCHDECSHELICPGVTDACTTWWECPDCADLKFDTEDAADEWSDRMWDGDDDLWHGKEHQRIDGMWMVRGEPPRCLTQELEHNAGDYAWSIPDGDHPIHLEPEEGFVYIITIGTEATP